MLDELNAIAAECDRAKWLHPIWPKDRVYQVAILVEEVGEALTAAMHFELDPTCFEPTIRPSSAALRTELVQVGAMAVRCLESL